MGTAVIARLEGTAYFNELKTNRLLVENIKDMSAPKDGKGSMARTLERLKANRNEKLSSSSIGTEQNNESPQQLITSSHTNNGGSVTTRQDSPMVDEMLDGAQMDEDVMDSEDPGQAASNLLNELTANDHTVHNDFQSKFNVDMFNDKDLA